MDSNLLAVSDRHSPVGSGDSLRRLSAALQADFSQMMQAIAVEVSDVWPIYVDFAEEHHTRLADAAEVVVPVLLATAFGDGADTPASLHELDPAVRGMFEEIGRAQFRGGHDLNSLLAAYQCGALVAWEHIANAAVTAALNAEQVSRLARTLFVVVQDLSARTSDGFVREQSWFGSATHRAQSELGNILLTATPDLTTIQNAADRAGWVLPDKVTFVLLADRGDELGASARVDPDWLLVHVDDVTGCVVPWAVGVQERLRRAFRSSGAVVGAPLPVTDVRRSMSHTRNARHLQRRRVLPDGVIFVADHLDTILVHRNPELLGELRQRVLAPVLDLPQAAQDRMVKTMVSWLRNMGSRSAIAEDLKIHPQTVRYRMEQLREIFGPAMEDPDQRRQLFLVLAWGEPESRD